MKKFAIFASVAGAALALTACDVDQTEEGELPEVDVEGGNMPEFDVEGPEVDVETGTETVEVPTLDVDVEGPGDAEGKPVTGNEE